MSELRYRVTEQVDAIWVNIKETLGGVAAPLLITLAVMVGIAIIMVAAIRLRPRRRVGYAMVPDPNFDPSLEEIVRFAAGLAEARVAIGRGTNSHRMVRLTICSDPQGRLVSLIGLNPRARSVAERNAYAGVDLAQPPDVLGELAPDWLPASRAAEPDPARAQDDIINSSIEISTPTPRPGGDAAAVPATVASDGRRWEGVL